MRPIVLRSFVLAGFALFIFCSTCLTTTNAQPASPVPLSASWIVALPTPQASETVGPGVSYEQFLLRSPAGPVVVHVTKIDLRNPYVHLSVATQNDAIVGKGETLSGMAGRLGAEAAVNGDYFDINETGSPLSIVVREGRIEHEPSAAAALIIGAQNAVSIGAVTLQVRISDVSGKQLVMSSINDWGKNGDAALLTPEFGATDAGGADEIVLAPSGAPGSFTVAAVASTLDALRPLPSGELAIVANPSRNIGSLFPTGDALSVTFTGSPAPSSIVSAIGGGPLLLHDGAPVSDPTAPAPEEAFVRYPVTGAGISKDGATMWLVAVDGRSPLRSVGMTRPELASLLLALGASEGMAFDSGGSTEMVVRHLGDATASVASAPSDGRERLIADGLMVENAAPAGAAASLFLRAQSNGVLNGSHLAVRAEAIDQNDQPVAVDPAALQFVSDTPNVASVGPDGTVVALRPGATHIVASMAGVRSDPLAVDVLPQVPRLSVARYGRDVPIGSAVHLGMVATDASGNTIAVDPNAVRWSARGDGSVSEDGTFTAGAVPGVARVQVQAGGAVAWTDLLVGEHAVLLQATPSAGTANGEWQPRGSPSGIPVSVDDAPAPDGSAALHLDYDFSSSGSTRAAYVESSLPLAGEPLAIGVDVYGDGHGEWLRAAYANADGVVDSVTLSRHVDWTGWKTVRAPISLEVRWPITLMRLYIVESDRNAAETGDLWFRNLQQFDASPAS